MDAYATAMLAPTVGWNGDVDWAVNRSQEAPMDSGGAVAQRGSGSAGEHRCHPLRLVAEPFVSHRIDTSVDAVKQPPLRALSDRAFRQSHLDELRRRHDPMLLTCDERDLRIHRGALVNHEDTKAPRPLDSPPLRA